MDKEHRRWMRKFMFEQRMRALWPWFIRLAAIIAMAGVGALFYSTMISLVLILLAILTVLFAIAGILLESQQLAVSVTSNVNIGSAPE